MCRPSARLRSWRRHRVRSLLAFGIVAVAFAAVAAGCGDGENGNAAPQSLPGAADQILTQSDVDRYPAASPQHALLQWWRDVQYANLTGYFDAFDPSIRQKLQQDSKARAALEYVSGSVRTARPAIASVRRRGPTATVYTAIKYRTPIGTRRFVTTSRPQAFVLVQRGGDWLLQNDSFVQSVLPVRLRRTA